MGVLSFFDAPSGTENPFTLKLLSVKIKPSEKRPLILLHHELTATLINEERTAHCALKFPLR
jgi:hypothetical protein